MRVAVGVTVGAGVADGVGVAEAAGARLGAVGCAVIRLLSAAGLVCGIDSAAIPRETNPTINDAARPIAETFRPEYLSQERRLVAKEYKDVKTSTANRTKSHPNGPGGGVTNVRTSIKTRKAAPT
ncbi:hypothetical protein [Sinomonas humi]|uniref:hypothetical protein n=1 Tax=Sinomonas humi TaxID=1338436 RepID=UPI00068A1BBA|nr:hypothetical protein [Sinomonas humi]